MHLRVGTVVLNVSGISYNIYNFIATTNAGAHMPKPPKSVRSLSIYEATIQRLGSFRIAHALPSTPAELLALGFDEHPAEGKSLIPIPVGPFSTFNANGREIVRRDLPKVSQSRMVWSTWNDWHGNPHSGMQIRSQNVYQKELVPPPEEYLTVMQGEAGLVLASRVLARTVDDESKLVHVINLFLELFGDLKITSADLKANQSLAVKRLNWRVLPPGEYPFERAKRELNQFLSQVDESVRPVVESRIMSVTQYKPDFVAVGVGGFREYVVFGFQSKNIYVLESPTLGNATYVFKNNWTAVSALSKKEILEGALHEARLVHNHRWTGLLRQAITGK